MPINSIGSILVIDDRQGSVSYIPNMLPKKTGKNIRYPYCNTSIVYKTIPINFNEITVGRSSIRFIPTYDLSKIDPENYTSRKHLMLYREDGHVYARNLSSKNTVHINGELLLENESKKLNNNDELILSGYIVTKFFKGDF